MKQTEVDRIKDYVASREHPELAEFVQLDRPEFRLTAYLVERLVGQPVAIVEEPSHSAVRLESRAGDLFVEIANLRHGKPDVRGLFSLDLAQFLLAIRMHEVNSFDLAYLPPDSRKADLDFFCRSNGLPVEKLHRLVDTWIGR
jgi:hypothetical protein